MTETEKAWLAGIVDADGYIGITSSGYQIKKSGQKTQRFQVRLVVENANKKMIDRISEITTNGYRWTTKRRNKKQTWVWIACNFNAQKITKEIYPYLVCKKDQADLLFRFPCGKLKHPQLRSYLHRKSKELHSKFRGF